MVLKQIIKLSIAASFALGVTTTHPMKKSIRVMKKSVQFIKKQSRFKKFASFFRNFEPKKIVTETMWGNFHFEYIAPASTPIRKKKIVKHRNIRVWNPEGGFDLYPSEEISYYPPEENPQEKPITQTDNKPARFGTSKKCEDKYYQETLKSLKQYVNRKYTTGEKYAGVPKAQKKFDLWLEKTIGKPIKKATIKDLKLLLSKLEKDEKLKPCNEAFIQELKKKKYHLSVKQCLGGNKKSCQQAKNYLWVIGKNLYWKNYKTYDILRATLSASHPKNFKNEKI